MKPPPNALALSTSLTWLYRVVLPVFGFLPALAYAPDRAWHFVALGVACGSILLAATLRLRIVELGGDGILYVLRWLRWVSVPLEHVAEVHETLQSPQLGLLRVRLHPGTDEVGAVLWILVDGSDWGEESTAAVALRTSLSTGDVITPIHARRGTRAQ